MTINWEKEQKLTRYEMKEEKDNFISFQFTGGELHDCIVEFTNINVVFDESEQISIVFDYDIKSESEKSFEKSQEMQVFFTNVILTHWGEELGK
tara:strand:+ start:62 stop:343 length:282 start_codon:yes stop_codon:yes gene_type:complete